MVLSPHPFAMKFFCYLLLELFGFLKIFVTKLGQNPDWGVLGLGLDNKI